MKLYCEKGHVWKTQTKKSFVSPERTALDPNCPLCDRPGTRQPATKETTEAGYAVRPYIGQMGYSNSDHTGGKIPRRSGY